MKLEVKKITPEIAMELLKMNTKNRKLKKQTVLDYADQMKRGQWKLTSQGITISDTGEVIDGQHRLAAIVKSNTTIDILVSNGLKYDDVFKVYDTGVRRTAADSLYISDVKYSSLISAIIKKKIQYDRENKSTGAGAGVIKITNTDVYNSYIEHEEIYQDIAKFSQKYYNKLKLISTSFTGGIAAHLIITKGHSFELVSSFFEQLFYNENVENESINVLRNKLISNALDNRKLTEMTKTIYIIKTWNCFITGTEISRFNIDINRDRNLTFK